MAVTENFYYSEGSASIKDLLKSLVNEITQKAGSYKWDLVYPASIDDVGSSGSGATIDLITDGSTTTLQHVFTPSIIKDNCIIKATTTKGKTFYVKIYRVASALDTLHQSAIDLFKSSHTWTEYIQGSSPIPHTRTDGEVLEYMNTIDITDSSGKTTGKTQYDIYVEAMTQSSNLEMNNFRFQIGSKLNTAGDDLDIDKTIQQNYNYRLAWYKNNDNVPLANYIPVQYWINITKDSINLILRGDPSADFAPYDNYLTSYAYIGSLSALDDDADVDDIYNFGITTASDIEPSYSTAYGERTGTGITDVCMLANKIGMPYQPHYPGFYATNPFMDKCNVEGSRWNRKRHQFSDVTLVHPIDMERGKMINVLIGDISGVYDMDKLIYKKGTDAEENYKKFTITAPYNFLNNSAHINYGVAIRCYQATE